MPADLWTELVSMVGCGLLVAGAVVPVSVAAWWLARRRGEPLLPRPKPWRVPWTGFEVLFAFLLAAEVLPRLALVALTRAGFFTAVYGPELPADTPGAHDLDQVRVIWARLAVVPVFLAGAFIARRLLHPGWRPPRDRRPAARLALAGFAWLGLTVVTFAVHFAVNLVFAGLGGGVEEHPLAKNAAYRTALDRAVFVAGACLAAPVTEEFLFRGLLLPWALGRRYRPGLVLVLAVLTAVGTAGPPDAGFRVFLRGPVLFAAGVALGGVGLRLLARRKRRVVGAVYAQAALFAAVHSAVWPSPIPLFVLGLGLGWLALRVRGWMVPAAVHGLFNAVSVVFVLLG